MMMYNRFGLLLDSELILYQNGLVDDRFYYEYLYLDFSGTEAFADNAMLSCNK
jgi:hypothetical protein